MTLGIVSGGAGVSEGVVNDLTKVIGMQALAATDSFTQFPTETNPTAHRKNLPPQPSEPYYYVEAG
jgi:hypothetical protein